MQKLKLAVMALVAFASFAGQAGAYSVTIDDTYIGTGTSGNYASYETKDVIGDTKVFDIQKMVVAFDGNNRLSSVSISTSYVSPLKNVGSYGTQLGDLFISTNGYATTDLQNDTMKTGEQWEYALVLSQHLLGSSLTTGGTIRLYRIAADRSNILQSSAPHGYIYREFQETQVNTSKSGYLLGNIGTWNIDAGILSFELTHTDLVDEYLGSGDFGFHWNMTCGNDTIEGGATAPVPEPSSYILLGAGILCAGLYRWKSRG